MKIGLRAGHSDNCLGAVGLVNEHEQMKKYYISVKELFEKYGHTVIDCNSNAAGENAELSEGANKCNSNNCDLFISLHMNSYNGEAHGTEVLVSSENSLAYPYAKRLASNFAALGFTNRGVKFVRDYEMNHISCGNIISEICFCDSAADIEIYNKYSWDKLAHVLCNAVDSNIPIEPTGNKEDTNRYFVVTRYLPASYKGYSGVNVKDIQDKYLSGVRCYIMSDSTGIWIETQCLSNSKCEELKEALGSLFYEIKEEA